MTDIIHMRLRFDIVVSSVCIIWVYYDWSSKTLCCSYVRKSLIYQH